MNLRTFRPFFFFFFFVFSEVFLGLRHEMDDSVFLTESSTTRRYHLDVCSRDSFLFIYFYLS